ncbi:MAG: acetyl-CoA carboxylase carboxyltransferase subunit alpha [Pyrinomonadaceae bacterium]|nr:acetyl-CoA carboxylase carboxyltransferase subunit alpha [Pyrinomonadaceae bacterium]
MKEQNSTSLSDISPIERVRLARHPNRPYFLDIINGIFTDFTELHGDRRYSDDAALIGGIARLNDHDLLVIGHQKGRDTKQRHFRNFGMPKPEGYRKYLRLMQMAEKFGRAIVTFVDTPGAYPGIDAEERGQAEAIAYNLRISAGLKVPIIVVIVGEGGSGGALAIGIGDRIIMFENSVYSVISPEGCAAILWKDAARADLAAASLKLTAPDLLRLNIVDELVSEPLEWKANSTNEQTAVLLNPLKNALVKNLDLLKKQPISKIVRKRWDKFSKLGSWSLA